MTSFSAESPARWSGCFRHTPTEGQAYRVDLPLASRGPAQDRWHGRWLARSLTTTARPHLGTAGAHQGPAGRRRPGARRGVPQSRRAVRLPQVSQLRRDQRDQGSQAAHRAEGRTGRGPSDSDVKTGHGGIRDIEFTIQFLQLLNGGDLPEVRQRNTLLAMQALAKAGCLTDQEYHILDDAYRFLRKTEHRLQLLFDLQTHRLPAADDELRKLALRMGYARQKAKSKIQGPKSKVQPRGTDPLALFLADYREKTELDRRILDHLLHQTFSSEDGQAEPESDLILDPQPEPETIRAVLGHYPFKDPAAAYQLLTQLATESVPFLSARRCRHFLASIAPRLLRAVAETPDPDLALFEPRAGDGVARRQGGAVGAVQLQPAQPEAVRRSVCDEPVLVRHPDQQSGHDRRACSTAWC